MPQRTEQPMTDGEHERFRAKMKAQHEAIAEALAEDLGEKPEDHFHQDE